MCKVLQLQRSTYYYEAKERAKEDDITSDVIEIFQASRQNYGTRKIKVELKKRGLIVSRRRIGQIMQENCLFSRYTVAQFKPQVKSCNESAQKNELNREFNQEEEMTVEVSDLKYVRVDR
jgi:putative transposase